MSKHTPGPWSVERSNKHGIIWIDAAESRLGDICDLYHITASDQLVAKDNAEANAKLIAAAPDLLEACKMFAEWLHEDNQHSPNSPYQIDRHAKAVKTTMAAIAKAEGVG